MNEHRINAITSYFVGHISQCKEQAQAFASDGRADEAVFARIQGNVYDIFHTIFSTSIKLQENDSSAIKEFFLHKTKQVTESWQSALLSAEEHGDFKKAHIEHIKIDCSAQIITSFQELWEADYD